MTFSELITNYERYLNVLHQDVLDQCPQEAPKLRMMFANLALRWLEDAGDVHSLAMLREQISAALGERALH